LEGATFEDTSLLKEFYNLTELSLARTPVKNILPLAKLTRLKVLDLGFTKVKDLSALMDLENLESLNHW
jgi:Leucine-rich repeat (LRR) protein